MEDPGAVAPGYLAHSQSTEGGALCGLHPVLGTGGEGALVTLVETWQDGGRGGSSLFALSALASRGTQEPGIQVQF